MSKLVTPGTPDNLHLSADMKAAVVESDLYDICERIKEISPKLFILMAHKNDEAAWIIMEHCDDGWDRLVLKVKELDARVLTHLRKMIAIPLAERIKAAEKMNYKHEQQLKEDALDELYERVGRPMWTQLEHDGFIQRGISYPKKGIKPS